MGKYDKYIYTIPKEYHNWEDYASPRGGLRGNESVPGWMLNMGFSVVTGANVMEVPHIHHAVDEYLFFVNADLVNFFDFDAEIEVWLGDDPEIMEKITITEPTVIRIPPNLWHCPINFKRIGKPVSFSPVYLDGDWSKITRRTNANGREEFIYEGANLRRCVKDRSKKCVYCGKCFAESAKEFTAVKPDSDPLAYYNEMAKLPRTGAFDKYVYTIKKEYHKFGDCFTNPRGGFPGYAVMEDTKLYTGFDVMLKECQMDEAHIHHAVDEYLYFTGSNLADFFDFDAEIEIWLGNDPDHMEKYTFTEPTIIRIPPNFWHCPINFKRIGKPVNFMPVYLDSCWSKISREKQADGRDKYIYEGVGLRNCVKNADKKCTFCGQCFTDRAKSDNV